MSDKSPAILPDDQRPDPRPIYGYVVTPLDAPDLPPYFLTDNADEFEVENMAATFPGAASPQTFSPAQIRHGEIRRESIFDKTVFEVLVLIDAVPELYRYLLTSAVPKIRIQIIRVNPGAADGEYPARWGVDCAIINTGNITSIGYEGQTVRAEVVPGPLFTANEIPRWRFSRKCNHQLYGKYCGADPAPRKIIGNIKTAAISDRSITIEAQHADDNGGYFNDGVLIHQKTGQRFTVTRSSKPNGTDTKAVLAQWSPEFEENDVVEMIAGCNHTFSQCKSKFGNQKNFGGFSEVPNKNPTFHGV